jgi:WD40 repeat protein
MVGTTSGKLYRMLTADLSYMIHTDAHSACINDIAFGSRSDQFACIDENGFVKLWDSSEYKTTFTAMPNKQCKGTSVCIGLNDNSLITGWRDGFIRAYDTQSKTQIWELANAHRGAVTVVYADANYILSGGQDGIVRVWDRNNRKMLIQFSDHKKDVQAVFPDVQKPFQIHSCGQDRSICTYDLKAEKKIVSH